MNAAGGQEMMGHKMIKWELGRGRQGDGIKSAMRERSLKLRGMIFFKSTNAQRQFFILLKRYFKMEQKTGRTED